MRISRLIILLQQHEHPLGLAEEDEAIARAGEDATMVRETGTGITPMRIKGLEIVQRIGRYGVNKAIDDQVGTVQRADAARPRWVGNIGGHEKRGIEGIGQTIQI